MHNFHLLLRSTESQADDLQLAQMIDQGNQSRPDVPITKGHNWKTFRRVIRALRRFSGYTDPISHSVLLSTSELFEIHGDESMSATEHLRRVI